VIFCKALRPFAALAERQPQRAQGVRVDFARSRPSSRVLLIDRDRAHGFRLLLGVADAAESITEESLDHVTPFSSAPCQSQTAC
jgi:hypothetical protein